MFGVRVSLVFLEFRSFGEAATAAAAWCRAATRGNRVSMHKLLMDVIVFRDFTPRLIGCGANEICYACAHMRYGPHALIQRSRLRAKRF